MTMVLSTMTYCQAFLLLLLAVWSRSQPMVPATVIELTAGSVYNLTIPDESYSDTATLPAWLVVGPEDCRTLVRFVDFALPDVDDTLVVGTGSDVWDSSSFFARFSGLFPRTSILLPASDGWLWLNSSLGDLDTISHRMLVELEAIKPLTSVTIPQDGNLRITSPGYPHDYPSYADISWIVPIPVGKSAVVRFIFVELEDYYDKVTIGTGSDISNQSSILTRISGQYNRTETPTDLILADESSFWLTFYSDNSKTYRGFCVDIFLQPSLTEEFLTTPLGNDVSVELGKPVNLASANYPHRYKHKENITWYFTPPINAQIRIDVISCHLEQKHDVVRIDSRANRSDPVLLTGNTTPRGFGVVYPVNASVRIRFETDFSISYQGFWIKVIAQYPLDDGTETNTMTMETTVFTYDGSGDVKAVANGNTIGLMIPLSAAMGAVFLLFVVFACVLAISFKKRRRTIPSQREQHAMSHLHSVPENDSLNTNRPPQPANAESPQPLDAPYAEFDYAAVNDSAADEKAEGATPETEAEYHPYSETTFVGDCKSGHDGYSKIVSDYAVPVENMYAQCDDVETGVDVSGPTYNVNSPHYCTSIEKAKKPRAENAYHVYTPMTESSRSAHSSPSPRKPKRTFRTAGRYGETNMGAVGYVNLPCALSEGHLSTNTSVHKSRQEMKINDGVKNESQTYDDGREGDKCNFYDSSYISMSSNAADADSGQSGEVGYAPRGGDFPDTYFAGSRRVPVMSAASDGRPAQRLPQAAGHTFSSSAGGAYMNATYAARGK